MPRKVARSFGDEVSEDDYELEIGKAKVGNEGSAVSMVTWGASLFACLGAMDNAPDDVDIELIDLRTIFPMDIDTIAESVEKTGRCIVVHEAPLTGGMGAEVSARIQERCFLHLEAPVQRVTGFDTIMPFYKLENEYLVDAKRIGSAIAETLAY